MISFKLVYFSTPYPKFYSPPLPLCDPPCLQAVAPPTLLVLHEAIACLWSTDQSPLTQYTSLTFNTQSIHSIHIPYNQATKHVASYDPKVLLTFV